MGGIGPGQDFKQLYQVINPSPKKLIPLDLAEEERASLAKVPPYDFHVFILPFGLHKPELKKNSCQWRPPYSMYEARGARV